MIKEEDGFVAVCEVAGVDVSVVCEALDKGDWQSCLVLVDCNEISVLQDGDSIAIGSRN